MVRTHIHTIALRRFNIIEVSLIDSATALGSFQIDVIEFMIAVFCNRFPPYITLIMAHVKTMNMATCVLALYGVLRSQARE